MFIKETSQLDKIKKELVQFASNLIMKEHYANRSEFEKRVESKLETFDGKYEQYLNGLVESEDDFERKLIDCYNQNCKQFKFDVEFKYFESTPTLTESIKTYLQREEPRYSWFVSVSSVYRFAQKMFKPSFSRENCINWIISIRDQKIIPDMQKQINKPFVEDSHVRSAFQIVNMHLFGDSSPVIQNLERFNLNKLTFDILVFTLNAMLSMYSKLKDQEICSKRQQYNQVRDKMRKCKQ